MIKPRVCLISHTYLEKGYRGKLPLLSQHVDLALVSPDRFPFSYGMLVEDFRTADYEVRTYPCIFPTGARRSTRWCLLSKDLGFASSPPDIIHVENELSSFLLLQVLASRRLFAPRARVVVFVWANQRLIGPKALVLNASARMARSGIHSYIAGNARGRDILLEDHVPAERIVVIPQSGVDCDGPELPETRTRLRSQLGMTPDGLVIGFVGRLTDEKGVHDLVSAFELLRACGRDVHLLFVGNGDLKRDLVDRPNVTVISPGGGSQAMQYYSVMDALVLPSRTRPQWREQFGRVLIEAMSRKVPVVGSDSGAIPEVIGDAGLVFPEGNVDQLVRRLETALLNRDARSALVERGLARVRTTYTNEVIAQQTLKVYERMI